MNTIKTKQVIEIIVSSNSRSIYTNFLMRYVYIFYFILVRGCKFNTIQDKTIRERAN